MSKSLKFLLFSYFGAIFALFLYSFTQVDLSLTISKASVFQVIEKQFQYLGFFQRSQSTIIFSLIMSFLFIFYGIFLYLCLKNKITKKYLFYLVLGTFILLTFSYNAFSYDLFNYIFDAKIVTHYGQNPFLHKPADFLADPMLNFMRWTHRLYPYGISWLVLTVPLSFIGANIFIFTFFLFKLLSGLSYLGSGYLIYKISEKISSSNKISNTLFFALNPLVLIEGLVSAHNDMPMVFITLLSFYLYLKKKKAVSFFSYIFSVGIKYATAVFIPSVLYIWLFNKLSRKINWEHFFTFSLLLSLLTVIFASLRTTFQPWYFLLSFAIASFIFRKFYVFIPVVIISLTSVAIYAVYVFMTDYAKEYPQIIERIELIGLITAIILPLIYLFLKKIR